jgi:hypothetical protein
MSSRRSVLVVCPSSWDHVQVPATRSARLGDFDVRFAAEEAEDFPHRFDALGFIEQIVSRFNAGSSERIDGVTSSSDYPGCIVAAAIATALDLPGPAPERVLACSHKYYARLAQRRAAPEATPRFAIVDPSTPSRVTRTMEFPLFVKPVKSWFSILAEPMDSLADLKAYVHRPDVRSHLTEFVGPFNRLVRRYARFEYDGSYLLAEELLRGTQVTVEGFVSGGHVQIIGIVDSVMFPGTKSFQRFDYPSALPEDVQRRMEAVVRRIIVEIGLDQSLFNVELIYDRASDRVAIIEINPRMCGQFADMMESVNGTNTYEVLLELATGQRPDSCAGAGTFKVAASFPLRAFEDARVVRLPDPEEIEDVKRQFPVTIVKSGYYREGQRLSDLPENSDGLTYRYGVINMAGDDRPSMLRDFEEAHRRLSFVLEPV